MAIGIQYGATLEAGRAAFASGQGEHNKYLQGLALQVQEQNRADKALDLAIEEAVQRERMQQRDIGFRDVAQQRDINLSDRSRRETFDNSNAQLQYSTENQNKRLLIEQSQANLRLTYSEQQQNARTGAQLTANRLNTLSQLQASAQQQQVGIAAQQQQAVLNSQLDARARQQQGLISAQLGQVQAGIQSQQAYQNAQLGVQSAYATAPLQAQQQMMQQNAKLLQQGYTYNPQDQAVVSQLQSNIQKIQQSNLNPAIKQQAIAEQQQQIMQISPNQKPPKLQLQDDFQSSVIPSSGGYFVKDPQTGQFNFKSNALEATQARNQAAAAAQQQELEYKKWETQFKAGTGVTAPQLSANDILTGAQKLYSESQSKAETPGGGISFEQATSDFVQNYQTAHAATVQMGVINDLKNIQAQANSSGNAQAAQAARQLQSLLERYGPNRTSWPPAAIQDWNARVQYIGHYVQ